MSLSIRRGLYGKLSGDTTLNNLLGTPAPGYAKAIYYQEAPAAATFPYVIFSKQSGSPTYSMSATAFNDDVWMVKGVDRGTSADGADAVSDRLSALLNDASLSISGANHKYLRRESDVDYPELTDGVTYHHSGGLYRLVSEPT